MYNRNKSQSNEFLLTYFVAAPMHSIIERYIVVRNSSSRKKRREKNNFLNNLPETVNKIEIYELIYLRIEILKKNQIYITNYETNYELYGKSEK